MIDINVIEVRWSMKFECYYEILKWFSKFGFVKVFDLFNSFNVMKEIICLDFNEFVRFGYLIWCYGGVFIVLDLFDIIVKNEIVYVFENYDIVQGIKKGYLIMKS